MNNAYHFPGSQPGDQPIILSYANGFPPQTYTAALHPLFADHAVIAAHMRPLWQPTPPPTLKNWRTFADDLLSFLDKNFRQSDFPLIGIGHSIGAVTTLYAAVKEPERFAGIVLIDPTMLPPRVLLGVRLIRMLGRDARLPLVNGALRRGREWSDAEAAYEYFRGKKLFARTSDAGVRAYTESITRTDEQGTHLIYPPEWEAEIYRTLPTDVWSLPQKLRVPTLILRGELTDVFSTTSAAHFKRLNPKAHIVTIPGAGHLIPQERPGETGKAIQEFVRDLKT
jgi:pimeloyl-ACP methyl ester carboxylesterase